MTDLATSLAFYRSDVEERRPQLQAVATVAPSRAIRAQLVLKRALDIVMSAAALIIAAPVMLAIALLVRLDSNGPIVFRQERVGVGGRRFRIFKFRTMVDGAESVLALDPALRSRYVANNFKLAVDDDPRITKIGAFLRRTSLDELPQFWNVLRGDMSLVGARPLPEAHFHSFGPSQERYVSMRPGITGPWQVGGRSNAGHEMAALTERYVENWNLLTDVGILLKTVPAVLSRRGAC